MIADDILYALGDGPTPAAKLAEQLGADICDVYGTLAELEADGVVEIMRVTIPRTWSLCATPPLRRRPDFYAGVVVTGDL